MLLKHCIPKIVCTSRMFMVNEYLQEKSQSKLLLHYVGVRYSLYLTSNYKQEERLYKPFRFVISCFEIILKNKHL